MDLEEFKKEVIKKELGITENFDNTLVFIDFSNMNYWYETDAKDEIGDVLPVDKKLTIDVEKLKLFTELFSPSSRFYYGIDPQNRGSLGFISAVRNYFGKSKVFTKPIQKIRHHLKDEEAALNTRSVNQDLEGRYVYIPKCNFDVEICVDAIRLLDKYDTLCLFSSDADFISLLNYIKTKGKKIILIKSGYVQQNLLKSADLVIGAQDIKKYIAVKKQKSSFVS
ncbi:NYN domain-containing protein [Patescibacteria group bacterium]|nr:NYN domain-containing protein [Patescibacteria group bacterium]MBU2233409.1 NYN domain-containing protein [Patescibacteria group bacterium]MBU2264214.1 NYN domain-containing protein [Patescibacteria group bacterium]